MTGTEIITRFNLQIDDASELSDTEALALANEVYDDIANDRPWEWLRASFSGSTSTSVAYIALPSDFKAMMASYTTPDGELVPAVFVGTTYDPYLIIPYSQRMNYLNTDGYAYIDPINSRLVFCLQPVTVKAAIYDYVKVHTALTTGTSPLFRAGLHKIIPYGMAAAFNPIEGTDKNISYQGENQKKYDDILTDMQIEDAQAKLAYT